jgi:hypothetical protein
MGQIGGPHYFALPGEAFAQTMMFLIMPLSV